MCSSDLIVFTTFHQTKGLERDYVYIVKNNVENEINNPLYVACTRMKKQLTIINYIYTTEYKKHNDKKYNKLIDFIKNIHPTLEYVIYEKYIKNSIKIINEYNQGINLLKSNIKLLFKADNNFFIYENIDNINNKVIIRWFEYRLFNKITFLDDFIKNDYLKNNSKEICNLYDIYNKKKDVSLPFIYKLCLEEEYMNNGFMFRKNIIDTDKYFSDDILNKNIEYILNTLKKRIGNLNKYLFEKNIFNKELKLIANFDIIDNENNIIYYIKINNNLINQKDIIQFYLNIIIIEFYYNIKKETQYIIFNPITSEEINIEYNKDKANIVYMKILDEIKNTENAVNK